MSTNAQSHGRGLQQLASARASARSLRHPLAFRRRKARPEISTYQCAQGRIAVWKFFAQPAVDSPDTSRSRGVNHAFAEDCGHPRRSGPGGTRDHRAVSGCRGRGPSWLVGLPRHPGTRPHPVARPVVLDQDLKEPYITVSSPGASDRFNTRSRGDSRQKHAALLALRKMASVDVWRPRPRSVRQLLVG
jgi:hypothetical protein